MWQAKEHLTAIRICGKQTNTSQQYVYVASKPTPHGNTCMWQANQHLTAIRICGKQTNTSQQYVYVASKPTPHSNTYMWQANQHLTAIRICGKQTNTSQQYVYVASKPTPHSNMYMWQANQHITSSNNQTATHSVDSAPNRNISSDLYPKEAPLFQIHIKSTFTVNTINGTPRMLESNGNSNIELQCKKLAKLNAYTMSRSISHTMSCTMSEHQ